MLRKEKVQVFTLGLIFIALLFSFPTFAQNASNGKEIFTIEQVLSAPFPSNLVAAPGAAKVAWVQNAGGVRNIWLAEGPDYKGRQLTSYAEDDGQELGGLQFTPDNQNIIYVRGGGGNRQGEIPNPLSWPDGAKQEIWMAPANGDSLRKLAEGNAPAISPTGDLVTFINRRQVWSVVLDAGSKPEQMFKIRGRAGSLHWSPDGSRLAFVSSRGDHSFVGAYHLDSKSLKYLDPSLDRDGSPVWSPDGNRIAFSRTPNQRQRLPFSPRRSALPWSIRLSDVQTGKGQEIWKADEGPGSSFRFISAANQLMWGDGNRLVFPWEKDGWTHLYAVSVNGGEAKLLTPGKFEVQFVSLAPDRKEVIYSSNQKDIDRQHLWRVAVSGSSPKQVTSGKGIEWSPVKIAGDNAIAFLSSAANMPAHASIISSTNTARALAPESMPEDFPAQHLVAPQQVIFSAADGMKIHGQLFLPKKNKQGEKRPALLFFHGGSRRQMLLGFHHRGYYHNAYALNQYLASRGFIVLSVN
ncbi:MAG: DPP IV N-terminal domain-containing protein [bacterium]